MNGAAGRCGACHVPIGSAVAPCGMSKLTCLFLCRLPGVLSSGWRHVVDRFRLAGATNVLWVWSPHVAYQYWELYFPGADYVDWIATGVLNFGPIAQWSQWWTFEHIFGPKYPGLASFNKPVMVAEFGSLAVGGDRAEWYRQALTDLPARYPAVRALLFFEAAVDQTVTYQKVDWTVAGDSVLAATIRQAISPWAPHNDR